MKKLFAVFLLVLLGLSAVALWLKPSRVRNGKIVLSYACPEFWAKREQVDLFNRLNPKYEVQIDAGNYDMDKVIVQSVAGVGPDLFNAYAAEQAAAYVKAGIAWDVTDAMKAAGIDVAGSTWPATHAFVLFDGRVYGFPYAAFAEVLFYNKEIFDRMKIPYPTGTLQRAEFLDLAQRLTVRDVSGHVRHYGFLFPSWQFWRDLIRQWGGRIFSADGTRCEFDCPENVAAIQFMQDLIWKYDVSPSPEQESGMATTGGWGSGNITWFGSGRAGLTMGGRHYQVAYRQKDQYPNLRIGIVECQFGPIRASSGYAGCVMINRYSPLREHALNYLKFMSGDTFNVLVNSQADGLAPVRHFAYTDAYLHNPAHPEEDQNEVWRRALEIANPDETCAFVNEAVANRIISEQLDLVRNNQKTAEAAVKSAARQINAEIEKNLKKNKELKTRYDALRAEKKQVQL